MHNLQLINQIKNLAVPKEDLSASQSPANSTDDRMELDEFESEKQHESTSRNLNSFNAQVINELVSFLA